ncbi:TPA: ead/Ea22-like family protein [Enterobacter hormaechei]|nr:ead/Ea22-like family protein [Enterobacter hormaechei]
MSNIDKQALREAAEKATPGEWKRMMRNSDELMTTFHGIAIGNVFVELTTGKRDIFDAEFIAASNPATVLALLDELEAKDSTIATQQQEIRTLLNALGQSSEKRNSDLPDQKRIIGWRASDYTDETSDPELAKNWAAAIGVLPIFEGDVNTKLSAAAAGKGE